MIAIDEGHLRFEFGLEWDHVEQWDKTSEFKAGIHCVQGVRALDIIALSRANKECLLLEVKDFRDQNDEEDAAIEHAKGRKKGRAATSDARSPTAGIQTASALVEQVAQKIAGTLAGLVGAARTQDTTYPADFVSIVAAHKSEGFKLRVVLWVEGHPTSKGQAIRAKSHLETLTRALKRKIAWLTHRPVAVLSNASGKTAIPGVKVIDLRPREAITRARPRYNAR